MDFHQQIIDAFRANGGEVTEPMDFGRMLALLHVPKKDGSVRVVPLAAVEEGGAWHVVGSAGGAPKHPAWVFGLRRADKIQIEVPGDPVETLTTTVTELDGAAREAIWDRFRDLHPAFSDYEKTAQGRLFPIFRLAPA